MQSAVTFNAVAVRSGALIGPSIGGVALAYGGYAFPFFINVGGFLGMLLALAAMRLSSRRADTASSRTSVWHGGTSGLDFVWHNPPRKGALGVEIEIGVCG